MHLLSLVEPLALPQRMVMLVFHKEAFPNRCSWSMSLGPEAALQLLL